jgi:hypothetical protein
MKNWGWIVGALAVLAALYFLAQWQYTRISSAAGGAVSTAGTLASSLFSQLTAATADSSTSDSGGDVPIAG